MEITMPDILVVKSTAFLPSDRMQAILDNIMAQKETGVILLPSYLEAQIVPDDIEIRFANGNGECVLIPTKN
jgi:hypothetical protein